MNKITKGDAKAYYNKMKRKERIKVMANILLLVPVLGIIAWLVGCSTEQTVAKGETVLERANRVDGYNPNRDYEVEYLNGLLNGHGITAFRIDPTNPEHQRRYRRHLEEPNYFHTIVEEDI